MLTPTAKVHAAAWKQMFDEFLRKRGGRPGEDDSPFDVAADYDAYVDGKPRYEGVASFLEKRAASYSDRVSDGLPELGLEEAEWS